MSEIDREHTYAILHCHTELSTCTTNVDSVTSYGEYIDQAKQDGLYGVTFTEHGNVFEWFHKKQHCEKNGFKYIHAVEAYITEDEPWFPVKGEKPPERRRDNYHCCLYAKNHDGFRELNRLVSQSFNRADVDVVPGAGVHYYYRPRITYGELKATSNNIIVSTACMAGILSEGPDELQSDFIEWLTAHRDRCYLEVQHHPCEAQAQYNRKLADISHRTGIPLLACTDTHSLNEEKALGRSVLQKSKNTFFENEADWDLVYKTYDELVAAFEKQGSLMPDEYIAAIRNTLVLTDSCEEYEIDCGKKYPHIYDDPVGTFKRKINEAYKTHPYVKDRYSFKEFSDRIKWEFDTYERVGAIDFMLLQVYLREWERKNGIQCGYGRGSVSGSEIAYVLGITEMDSMKYGLNFTRFMNASRVTNADIDTDYSEEDRDKVKRFLLHDHMNLDNIQCSEIVTFNSIKERGAIRDIARALQIPLDEVDQIADLAEYDPDSARKKYPELFRIVDIVGGTIVSMGTHPSGVLVSDLNLAEEVGLCSSGSSKYPISMLNMKELDTQFYVKLDILGVCNIRLINETCRLAGIPRMGPDTVDINDENVWKSIRDDTTGIFQWESESAQAFIKKMFSDRTIAIAKSVNPNFSYMKLLSFANGLIRPGCASFRDSVANGEIVTTGFKELDESLVTTFGHVAMQEDILALLKNFAGYNDVEADNVRRCVDQDTLIMMGNGNFKPIKDINSGERVMSMTEYGSFSPFVVEDVFDNGEAEVFEITTQHGCYIRVTKNHKFFTQRGWISAGDLTDSDYIMTPSAINADGDGLKPHSRLSMKEMFMLGLLIGDGTLGGDQIIFTNHERALVDKYEECVESRLKRGGKCKFREAYQIGKTVDKIYQVSIVSPNYKKSLMRLINELGLRTKSAQKHIPDCIMSYPRGNKLLSLLAGLFNTDGGVRRGGNSLEYSTISKKLAWQIKSLLLKYGIYSYVAKKYVAGYDYYSYIVMISQRDSLGRFGETVLPLMIGEKRDEFALIIENSGNGYNYMMPEVCLSEIKKVVGITNASMRDIGMRNGWGTYFATSSGCDQISDVKAAKFVANLNCPETYKILRSNYIPVRIKKIESVGISHVYDLQVNGTHNYVANNLVAHNCIAKKYGTEDQLDEIHDRFISYSHEHYGVSTDKLEEIFVPLRQGILDASDYAFSWNHSDAYSMIGYISGYLRYYYPKEFITAALNTFADKPEKTLTFTDYARRNNIKIYPVKFRHSRAEYSCDDAGIYKGIASIKHLNKRAADDLYKLRGNQYVSFVDLLIDIKKKTRVKSDQLKILTCLDFFSEFGDIHYLLAVTQLFDELYERSSIRKDDEIVQMCGEDTVTLYAGRITKKQYMDVDTIGILREIAKTLPYEPCTVFDHIAYENQYLGYINYTIPNIKDSVYYVTEVKKVYKNYIVTLYQLRSGRERVVKVRESKMQRDKFEEGNVVHALNISHEKKWKHDANGKWIRGDEYEDIMKNWNLIDTERLKGRTIAS